MESLEILIAGMVQGFTEFLPVSSSGHLVFVHAIFGFKEPTMIFDVYLHFATLLAVVIFFRGDILDIFRKRQWGLAMMIAAASVPAVAAGLLFESKVEALFSDPFRVCLMLLVTGGILFAAHFLRNIRKAEGTSPNFLSAMVVGVAQAVALFPGISRSGATISAGMMSGIKAEEAFRFSFLLSIPVIAGAAGYHLFFTDIKSELAAEMSRYLPGMLLSFICGMFSLYILKSAIIHRKLHYFGFYCLAAGTAGLLLLK